MVYYSGRIEGVYKRSDPTPESESVERQGYIMKHAVIVTGGKQYRVAVDDVVYVEKLPVENDETVTFDQVLAVIDEESSVFGTPVVAGATVTATVVKKDVKSKKVRVYKMKPRKNYRRTQGHRQTYTKVQITAINA